MSETASQTPQAPPAGPAPVDLWIDAYNDHHIRAYDVSRVRIVRWAWYRGYLFGSKECEVRAYTGDRTYVVVAVCVGEDVARTAAAALLAALARHRHERGVLSHNGGYGWKFNSFDNAIA